MAELHNRHQECKNGCGQYIYFDKNSQVGHPSSDRWIPLNYNKDSGIFTNEAHNCPNNPYRNGHNGSSSTSKEIAAKMGPDPLDLAARMKIIEDKLDRLLAVVKSGTKDGGH